MAIHQTALDQFAAEPQTACLPHPPSTSEQATAQVLPLHSSLTASELWLALKEERIAPHYQTQFELDSRRTVAVETLARIIDEDGEPIRPDRFIAEAESSGVIVPLGRSILRQACRALADWRASGSHLQRVTVNLSSRQLALDTTLVPFLRRSVAEFGLTAADFEFELTEDQFLQTGCLGLDTLSELKALGARLAIDDFGSNHAFISELASTDADTVKLHPTIVRRISHDRKAANLARCLIAYANALGKDVVAVGIETDSQLDQLRQFGCRYGQGYVHTRATSQSDLQLFLKA